MNGQYKLEKTLDEAFRQADVINERVTRVIPVTCDEIDRECLQLIKEWKKK